MSENSPSRTPNNEGRPVNNTLRYLVIGCALALLAGCSIESSPSPDPAKRGLSCVKGHDELTHHSGGVSETTFVCDLYAPTAKATP